MWNDSVKCIETNFGYFNESHIKKKINMDFLYCYISGLLILIKIDKLETFKNAVNMLFSNLFFITDYT